MGSYIRVSCGQKFLNAHTEALMPRVSYIQSFLHGGVFHLGVLMFRGSYIRCTFVQRFLQYIQGLLSSTFRSSYVFMGFLYSGALLFKDRFSSGHDVRLLRSCVFI